MDKEFLGELEMALLLTIMKVGGDAYGVPIRREAIKRYGKNITIGALYTTLERLETKGYVKSWLGESTQERGGKAKRYFEVQAEGCQALENSHNRSQALWAGFPELGVT